MHLHAAVGPRVTVLCALAAPAQTQHTKAEVMRVNACRTMACASRRSRASKAFAAEAEGLLAIVHATRRAARVPVSKQFSTLAAVCKGAVADQLFRVLIPIVLQIILRHSTLDAQENTPALHPITRPRPPVLRVLISR